MYVCIYIYIYIHNQLTSNYFFHDMYIYTHIYANYHIDLNSINLLCITCIRRKPTTLLNGQFCNSRLLSFGALQTVAHFMLTKWLFTNHLMLLKE